jgi:hypothetical protein
MKPLLQYLAESYGHVLRTLNYVRIFELLLLKHEQNKVGNHAWGSLCGMGPCASAVSCLLPTILMHCWRQTSCRAVTQLFE